MPADIEDMTVMRIVVRNGAPMDLVELLLDNLRDAVAYLDSLPRCPRNTGPTPGSATDEEDHPRSVPERG